MTFGEALVVLMNRKGMTQTDLAAKSGVRKSTINELVKGRSKEPTLTKAKALADALEITLQDFIDLMDGDD